MLILAILLVYIFICALDIPLADAYQKNYDVIFAKEATNSFTEEDYQYGLKNEKEVYGAPSLSNKEIIYLFSK